jgi:hypothetical protein
MTQAFFHPAALELLWLQSRGRRRRLAARFFQPRRLILSAIACVLAVVWLGNAAMTIFLRQQASEETLRALLSWGLVFYSGWHVTKAAFFRPESPLEWAPSEHEILLAMPLRPRDLVAYQLISVAMTTLLKAGLFTLLLLPDLRCVPLGLIGVLLAMMMLELIRIAIQIIAWGLSRPAYLAYRAVVLLGLFAAGIAVGAVVMRDVTLSDPANVGNGLHQRAVDILVQLHASEIGYVGLPFEPILNLILAKAITPITALLAASAVAAETGLAAAIIGLYGFTARRVAEREMHRYAASLGNRGSSVGSTKSEPESSSSAGGVRPLPIPRIGGAGPLIWRQLVGARRHWGSLLTAMIAPAVLASAPCLAVADSRMAFLTSAGALAFYTFLLLPTALRFDFRRDLDRLATLKGLPLSPLATAVGQTLAPVIITSVFQTAVLAIVIVGRSLPPHYLFLTMLIMIPVNTLVFGLDNLIYLLYPYRVQQEGLEIFLRTMLTFTGKGLLFTLGLAAMVAWGMASTALSQGFGPWTGNAIDAPALFVGGMITGSSLLAAFVLYCVSRTYRNLDPIEDLPR